MKVIVAYSGGLDTSVIVKWVKEKYNAEVIGFCADVGQEEELNGVPTAEYLKEDARNTSVLYTTVSNHAAAAGLTVTEEEQAEAEKRDAGVDEAADASAKMLAEMVSTDIEASDNTALNRLGYFLGRWVYLIDAVDDCEDDIKTGSFNPLKKQYSLPDFKIYCERMLSLTVGEAINNLNKLEIYRFYDIIDNVLVYGTECSAKKVICKEVERCEKSV